MHRSNSSWDKRNKLHQQQTGFVLMSVLFVAILIGIIALYNARLEQKTARAEQIQLTAQRMNQWLEAASAFYRVSGGWPYSLDMTRQTGSIGSYQSSHNFQVSDLTAAYFMPASVEDYQDNAGCNSNQSQRRTTDITQSPTATAWASSSSTCASDTASAYLIRVDLDPACFDSSLHRPADCEFDHPNERFGIVAQVPSRTIAEAIAAKLPNSNVQQNPDIQDGKHWMVHVSIPVDPTQSQDNTPGPNKFASGYLPIAYSSYAHQGTSAFGNAYSLNGYLGIDSPNDTGYTYQYGNTQFDSGTVNNLLYGNNKETKSTYPYSLSYSEFDTSRIKYNTNSSDNDFYSCNGINNSYPNIVVSASGFQAPPDLMVDYYSSGYLNTFSSANQLITNPANISLAFINCSSDKLNLDPSTGEPTSRPTCTDFYPYSSLYGIETIGFAATRTQDQVNGWFYLVAMGMSTQAAGNASNSSLSITDSLKEKTSSGANTCTSQGHSVTCPPTMGVFPGDNNNDEYETQKNTNHYWSQRQQDHNANGNGILGLNYFFFCNRPIQN